MFLRAIPALALLGASILSHAQPGLTLAGDPSARLLWSRTFASPGDDWINDIVPMRGGRYLVTGFLNRADSSFQSDWRALAGIIGEDGTIVAAHEYGQGGGADAFWSGREAADGRLVLSGFTTRIGAGGIDALVLVARPDGVMIGERAFGGGGYDRFTGMTPASGGYVFLGHSQPAGEERRRLFAVRTDEAGAPVWERIIEGPESIGALYIEAASGDGFVVAGGIARGEDSDIFVLKLDSDGRELWRRTIGTPEARDVNHGLTLLPNGNIVVVGYSQSWGARDNDILAVILSPAGDVLRREMLGGAQDDRPILARSDAEGRVWIVGYTRSAGAGDWDLILARLDRDGAYEPGVIILGGTADDNGTAIRPLADGSVLVAGYSTGLGGGAQDAFVARIAGATFSPPHPAFERRTVPPPAR